MVEAKVKKLLSYDVFMSFVTYYPDGTVDVSKMFSPDCLDKWIKTRLNPVKFPQQSFKRVLYAHLRGADRRKPFPEKVEKALLRLLRNSNERSPWSLLGEKRQTVGRRGFKQLGFHEKKRKKIAAANPEEVEASSSFAHKLQTHNDILTQVLKSQFFHQCKQVLDRKNDEKQESISNFEDFRILPLEAQVFSTDLPVANFVTSRTWNLIHKDEKTVLLLGSDEVSVASKLCGIATLLPNDLVEGTLWRRGLFRNKDGSFDVFHARIEVEKMYLYVSFQLMTHMYPAMVSTPLRTTNAF